MIVTAFRPVHLARLRLQPAQAALSAEFLKPGYTDMLRAGGPCFTGMVDGQVIACAGVAEVWQGRALAWALVGEAAGRNMVALHRAVAGFLMQAPYRRIEATVDAGFDAAHRWIKLLGFQCETPDGMRQYNPNGGDAFLYSRTK